MTATRTYAIVLEPMQEGGFLVHVPALPEVVTGGDQGPHGRQTGRAGADDAVPGSRRTRVVVAHASTLAGSNPPW